MSNVISIVPNINIDKLKDEIERIDKIQRMAEQMQMHCKSEKAKMIEHTAKYLKKLIEEI